MRGPALYNRKLCTNSDDFVTMEPLNEINGLQFFSYKDVDNFIYGFDYASIYGCLANEKNENNSNFKNPYNRNTISDSIIKNIIRIEKLSKLLKINIKINFEDEAPIISNEKAIELRALSLFQNINALGNYSDSQWFLSLNRNQLVKLMRELSDIWNYRAQIENQVKRNICPPSGDPFRNLSINYISTEQNMTNIRKVILEVLEKFVNIGIDKDSKALGACYVLGALTIVNENAATSLPWLFQSFAYF
jgi:hypothetical protein